MILVLIFHIFSFLSRAFAAMAKSYTSQSYMNGNRSKRKAMNRNWSNQKANPALNTKAGNKQILQIDKIQ